MTRRIALLIVGSVAAAAWPAVVEGQCYRCSTGSPPPPACTTAGGEGGPGKEFCAVVQGQCVLSGNTCTPPDMDVAPRDTVRSKEMARLSAGASLHRTQAGQLFVRLPTGRLTRVMQARDGSMTVRTCDGANVPLRTFVAAAS